MITTPEASTAIKLPYRIISVKGQDATKLLQGQASCDVEKLEENHVSYGTANSPKGRMYGLFRLIRTSDGFLIRIHQEIAEQFVAQLSKYAVFFKCDVNLEDYTVHGYLKLPASVSTFPNTDHLAIPSNTDYLIKAIGEPVRYEIWNTAGSETVSSETASSENTIENTEMLNQWLALETLNGIPELYTETLDHFILQYLNLQELGAVSFNKGCYTGQEIIARMKFLGKLKKKTFLLKSDQQIDTSPGQEIFNQEGKKCGELVRGHFSSETGFAGLGILDLSYAEDPKAVFFSPSCDTPLAVFEINYN